MTDGENEDFAQVVAVCERMGNYCLTGGLAANCYTDSIFTVNVDIVLIVSAWTETHRLLEEMGFVVNEQQHSLSVSRPTSQRRFHLTNDSRYADFPNHAKKMEMMGCKEVCVVSLEDFLKSTIDSWKDPQHSSAQREKDAMNLLRIAERHPKLRPKLPEAFRDDSFDVVERRKMWRFKIKRAEWLMWIGGDDQNTIHRQLWQLFSDYAFFLTLNDLRKRSDQNPAEGVGFNRQLLFLLDSGFVAKQAMGIRCLVDWSKDVFSLRRLLEDLKQNRALMTREVYLACRGLPYDFALAKKLLYDGLIASGQFTTYQGIDMKPDDSERMHKCFDELSGVLPECRKRTDMISLEWLERLDSKIKHCEDVKLFATKFIAHPADTSSRAALTNTQTGVTLNRIEDCLKSLCHVADSISNQLLQSDLVGGVQVPQTFDIVENLDKGWIATGNLEAVRELWNQHCDTIKLWANG